MSHSKNLLDMLIHILNKKRENFERKNNRPFVYSIEFYYNFIKEVIDFDKEKDEEFKKTMCLVQYLMALWIFGQPYNYEYAYNFFVIISKYDKFLINYKNFIKTFTQKFEELDIFLKSNNIKKPEFNCILNKINYLNKI